MSSSILYPRSCRDGSRDHQKWKEGHFFDEHYSQSLAAMLEEYGACDASRRFVGVDCTSKYGVDELVPEHVSLKMGVQSRRMSFVYLLREPSQRLHSHYWHIKKGGFSIQCAYVLQHSFAELVDKLLSSNMNWGEWLSSCGREWVDSSLYPPQVERWFKHFEPEQFTFIPHRLHVDVARWPNGVHPVEHVWKKLRVGGAAPKKPLSMNHKDHRTLEEELPVNIRHDLEAWFEVNGGALGFAKLLVPTSADLYGYSESGLPRDVPSVARWLRENW